MKFYNVLKTGLSILWSFGAASSAQAQAKFKEQAEKEESKPSFDYAITFQIAFGVPILVYAIHHILLYFVHKEYERFIEKIEKSKDKIRTIQNLHGELKIILEILPRYKKTPGFGGNDLFTILMQAEKKYHDIETRFFRIIETSNSTPAQETLTDTHAKKNPFEPNKDHTILFNKTEEKNNSIYAEFSRINRFLSFNEYFKECNRLILLLGQYIELSSSAPEKFLHILREINSTVKMTLNRKVLEQINTSCQELRNLTKNLNDALTNGKSFSRINEKIESKQTEIQGLLNKFEEGDKKIDSTNFNHIKQAKEEVGYNIKKLFSETTETNFFIIIDHIDLEARLKKATFEFCLILTSDNSNLASLATEIEQKLYAHQVIGNNDRKFLIELLSLLKRYKYLQNCIQAQKAHIEAIQHLKNAKDSIIKGQPSLSLNRTAKDALKIFERLAQEANKDINIKIKIKKDDFGKVSFLEPSDNMDIVTEINSENIFLNGKLIPVSIREDIKRQQKYSTTSSYKGTSIQESNLDINMVSTDRHSDKSGLTDASEPIELSGLEDVVKEETALRENLLEKLTRLHATFDPTFETNYQKVENTTLGCIETQETYINLFTIRHNAIRANLILCILVILEKRLFKIQIDNPDDLRLLRNSLAHTVETEYSPEFDHALQRLVTQIIEKTPLFEADSDKSLDIFQDLMNPSTMSVSPTAKLIKSCINDLLLFQKLAQTKEYLPMLNITHNDINQAIYFQLSILAEICTQVEDRKGNAPLRRVRGALFHGGKPSGEHVTLALKNADAILHKILEEETHVGVAAKEMNLPSAANAAEYAPAPVSKTARKQIKN